MSDHAALLRLDWIEPCNSLYKVSEWYFIALDQVELGSC